MKLPYHALRQTAAALLGLALRELFSSVVLRESGIDQIGFTYKFSLGQPLEKGVLVLLEEKMRELAKRNLSVEMKEMMRENAAQLFRHHRQAYKAFLAEQHPYNIVPVIKIGDSFCDLGQPPFAVSTCEVVSFKLQTLEPVKGEEGTFLLTGTVFPDSKGLKNFLKKYEGAKQRDHRFLGRELGLFTHVDEVGKEGWFWLPKGAFIRETLLDWWRSAHKELGFLPITTPRLLSRGFSKAYSSFQDGWLVAQGDSGLEFALPDSLEFLHAAAFRLQQHSYRELPVRYTECTTVYARGLSGCGLFNVSPATIERAHIFCSEKQAPQEIISSLQFIEKTIKILAVECQWVLLSRGSKFAGTMEKWDKVHGWMTAALKEKALCYEERSSEFSFSGPRLVVRMKDALGREWDGPFIEVNFNSSERLGLRYQGADDEVHVPYMITRSMFGSIESCIAVLVESCGGKFPLWLAPEQARVLPVSEACYSYAEDVCRRLVEAGVRCRTDFRQEPLGRKVHDVERERVPYAVIVGEAEQKDGAISLRASCSEGKTKRMKVESFLELVLDESKRVVELQAPIK